MKKYTMNNVFDLTGKIALITGAGSPLGPKHAEALIEQGAEVVITDHHEDRAKAVSAHLNDKYNKACTTFYHMDTTNKNSVQQVANDLDGVDILINNSAKDPKVKKEAGHPPDSRFETMTEEYWQEGIDAALNGTFLCSQAFSNKMLKNAGGVILNIGSNLGVVAPDQCIYRRGNVSEEAQSVKPITHSAAKWAIIGMTKYLAVYFAKQNIRVNCLSPTGVSNNHPEDFVEKLSNVIPMGRMAHIDEYKGAIAFLCSDASSYVTGKNMVIDGGRAVW